MQLERGKQLRLDDGGPGTSPDAGGVIEDQLPGHTTDVFEDGAQSMADTFRGFPAVGLDKAHIGKWERHDQDMQLQSLASDQGFCFAEINLGSARCPGQFDETITGRPAVLAPEFDVALNCGIRAGVIIFGDEAVKDTLARVALFAGTFFIVFEPAIDDDFESVECFSAWAFGGGGWCWGEVFDAGVFRYRVTADAESAGDFTVGDSLGVESPDIFYNGHVYRHLLSGSFLRSAPLVKRVGKRRGGTYLTVAVHMTVRL